MKARAAARNGSILILALWTLFFLAALAVAVGAHVAAGMRLAANLRDDVAARALAQAAFAEAALLVVCNTNAWDGLSAESWNIDHPALRPTPLGEGTFWVEHVIPGRDGHSVTNIGIVGENGRIDLNRLNRQVFEALLRREGGLSPAAAQALRAALDAYRQAKRDHLLTQQRAADYAPEVFRRQTGPGKIESVDELRFVEGMTDDLLARIHPYVTVAGGGGINVNVADPALLACCAEAFPETRDAIETLLANRRQGRDVTTRDALGGIGFASVASTAFRGTAVGRARGHEVRIEFVVDKEGRRRFWHER